MTKTQLKKSTVADILQTPEYGDNLQKLLDLLWNSRQQARQKATLNNRILKAHEIDRLHEKGYWQAKTFIEEYKSVINKTSRLAAIEREYIREVGTSAYVTTIKQIQNAPKKRTAKGQKDMARWCNLKQIFDKVDFIDYQPRKGFKCKTYFGL